MTVRKLTLAAAAAAAMGLSMQAAADSDLAFGGGASASADLDFQIVIPNFVYFQVGDAVPGNVDLVDFDLTAGPTEPGTGTPVAAASTVNVVLNTNASNIDISSTTPASSGVLTSGGGDTIPFTDIAASAAVGDIPVPAFDGTTSFVPGGTGLSDTWSFEYSNNSVYPAGTYAATVTYTAASP